MGEKPFRIWLDKIDRFIKIDDIIKHLVLFKWKSEREKSGIKDSINHNFARIRIDSYNSLPMEKLLATH